MNLLKEKTTIVALLGGVILLGLVVALVIGKIDASAFAVAAASVGGFLGVLVGVLSGDSKHIETKTEA